MIGAGTTHSVSVDGGTTWINTAKMKNLDMAEETRGMNEDNYLDSTDKYKEFVAGVIDAGEIGVELKWNITDVGQVALDAAFEGSGEIMGKVTFPDTSTFIYDGRTQSRGLTVTSEETITRPYKLKISGKPTFAEAP